MRHRLGPGEQREPGGEWRVRQLVAMRPDPNRMLVHGEACFSLAGREQRRGPPGGPRGRSSETPSDTLPLSTSKEPVGSELTGSPFTSYCVFLPSSIVRPSTWHKMLRNGLNQGDKTLCPLCAVTQSISPGINITIDATVPLNSSLGIPATDPSTGPL